MALLDDINTLNQWANESRILLYNLEDDLPSQAFSGFFNQTHEYIATYVVNNRNALLQLIESMQWFIYGYTTSYNYVYWRNVHLGLYENVPEITWKTIVEAWAKDDFEGRFWTIATIDRMRQIMWDEPFNVMWAARPEEQEP